MNLFFSSVLACVVALAFTACETTSPAAQQKPAPQPVSTFYPAPASMVGKAVGQDKHGMPTYKDSTRTRYVRATAFSHQENEPGAVGRLSAAGNTLRYGQVRSAAADWSRYPLGTKFKVKGLPYTYIVDDYGSALVGTNTVDMYFPTLRQMRKWGTRKIEITVISWGDRERTAKILRGRTKYRHCAKMYYALKRRMRNTASN